MSNLKIKYAFLTTESAEYYAVDSFIAGYELHGGTWDGGTMDVEEYVWTDSFSEEYLDSLIANGYDMVIRNSAYNTTLLTEVPDLISRGLLPVIPAGGNYYRQQTAALNKYSVVLCGSGMRDVGNATAFPCMFYDVSPYEIPVEIVDIRQCGTQYTITEIARISSTVIGIKLDGYSTEALLREIGIFMYTNVLGSNHSDLPIYISELAGTDITALPSGTKYISYVGNGYFYITHSTSAGTLTTYQSVSAGKIYFGSTDTTLMMLQMREYNLATTYTGIAITGVDDFDNSPNGIRQVNEWISNQGFGDKLTIRHNLGGGSYTSGGELLFASESYSTPFIAGQLAYIKDTTGYDWYDVIGNAIKTSSSGGVFDTYSGYGYLNANVGSDALIDISLEAPVLTNDGSTKYHGNYYQYLSWSLVPYAEQYELWFRGELLETFEAHILTYIHYLDRYSKDKKNFYKVRAKRKGKYSDFSNIIEFKLYYYTGILVKDYT